jgi:hypothetical protein
MRASISTRRRQGELTVRYAVVPLSAREGVAVVVDTELLHSGPNESHHAHQRVLTALGREAHHAAIGFTDIDERNAAKLRAVRCSSAT